MGRKRAQMYAENISTSQLRQIYGAIKQVEHRYQTGENREEIVRELQLLKPKLAYMSARNPEAEEFKKWVIKWIEKVQSAGNIGPKHFFVQMETFVAYHNYIQEQQSSDLETPIERIDRENISQVAEEHGRKYYEQGMKTSQIRHIYAEVKRAEGMYRKSDIEDSDKHYKAISKAQAHLRLLSSNLCYMAARHESTEEFAADMQGWIQYAVKEGEQALNAFFELMEAIVAFHKYYTETKGEN